MAEIRHKSLLEPDERESYPMGHSDEVHLGEVVVARTFQEPGWRWSMHIQPIVGTPSCRFHHTGVVLSGRLRARLDDGTDAEIGPMEVFDLPPGHDAWVVLVSDTTRGLIEGGELTFVSRGPIRLRGVAAERGVYVAG